jgi:osmotically-inducible protein OsmY
MRRLLAVAVLATGVAAVAVGCGSTPPERTAGDAIDDQAITRRIQEALSSDPAYKFGDVKVTTYQGKVQLSGFVDRDEQRGQAEEIAKRIRGVKEVKNDIARKR